MSNNIKYEDGDAKIIENVYLPEVSYGWCRVGRCQIYDWLADGYCEHHWDNGYQKKPKKNNQYL